MRGNYIQDDPYGTVLAAVLAAAKVRWMTASCGWDSLVFRCLGLGSVVLSPPLR